VTRQAGILGPALDLEDRAGRQAAQMLERYGVVAREFYRREDLLPWSLIAAEFQKMEMQGDVRRGYFVAGMSGMQYALPAAVEELRRVKSATADQRSVVVINACDPANPFGPGIELRQRQDQAGEIRVLRLPGNSIAFCGGNPVLYTENYGSRLWTIGEPDAEILRSALGNLLQSASPPHGKGSLRQIVVEYCDGTRPAGTPIEAVLRSLGFYRDMNQTMRWDGPRHPPRL
jgi:ATP-dependent Lhr-like helicase